MAKIRLLLVDDEEEFVNTLAERLELRDFGVTVSHDGESALGIAGEESFDAIVLDVMMPGMSGIDVLKQLKAENNPVPVILLTGHGSTKDGIEGMRYGAFDYLMKPIDIEELTAKIRQAVEKDQG